MIDTIKMQNGINVKVDKGSVTGINKYEIEEHLEDLFKFKKKYKKSEVIELSNFL